MSTAVRVAAFAAGLLAVLGLSWAGGALIGPEGTDAEPPSHADAAPHVDDTEQPDDDTHADDATHADEGAHAEDVAGGPAHLPGGLMISQDGYTLALVDDRVEAAPRAELAFRITGPDGQPVTQYETSHDKDLHLIVVRTDMAAYQHVHPERDDAGTWHVPVDLSEAGVYRVFADFVPGGRDDGLVLGADLSVRGTYDPEPLPAPAPSAVVDGYTVTMDGHPHAGEESELSFTVSKDGEPVTDLQPYLGAYGHLVALRDGDLAYLHVHPQGHPGDGATPAGPEVAFAATAPSPGLYRLFLDFQHDGVVRTAELTVEVTP